MSAGTGLSSPEPEARERAFSPPVASLLDRYRMPLGLRPTLHRYPRRRPRQLGGLAYLRLHGSPRTYWSRCDENAIAVLAATIGSITADEQVGVYRQHRKRRRHRERVGTP